MWCSDLDKRMIEKLASSPAFGGFNFKAKLEEFVSFLTEAVWYLWSRAVAHSKHDAHVVVKLSPWDLEREGRGGEGRGEGGEGRGEGGEGRGRGEGGEGIGRGREREGRGRGGEGMGGHKER